ncbi:MAG: hypothetical protein OXB88_02730 [Bacteriovoracales bacterium]|nr:hypothetical protein [Bacteriovoracales bacterium]
MGLLYPFPIDQDEEDRVVVGEDSSVLLKSYGLPYLFWGYLLAGLSVLAVLALAAKAPLEKMMGSQDPINSFLAVLVIATLIAVPLVAISFFFLEFRIHKRGQSLILTTHLFALPLRRRHFDLKDVGPLSISPFLGSPNMARRKNDPAHKAHQNRGYFELHLHTRDEKKVLVDRHSRKADLEKLKDLLERF